MEREIVKVQRAVVPSDAPWLVYDSRRQRQEMIRPSVDLVKTLGQELKAYFFATYDRGAWTLFERAPRQGW